MNLLDILNIFREYKDIIVILIVIFLSLVEITPIKINPWTWLFQRARNILGISEISKGLRDVRIRMDELDQKMDSVQKDNEEHENLKEALESRRRILGFNDELLQGFQHSQEMFGNVLDDITYYDDYCRNHPEFVNQRAILAESNIKRVYQECMEKRIFL